MFHYTASGQKVAKLVYQTGKPVQRTDYLGPFQYEGDSLRFFPHAEGRVLRFVSYDAAHQPSTRYEREFTFKDHLGNLRLAYRLGQVRTYRAGLEPVDAPRETHQFDSLSVSAPIAFATARAHTSGYVARLNAGGPAPQPLGPLTQFAVQKGDTVRATAFGLYPQATRNNSFAFSLAGFLAALLQPAPAGTPPGVDGSRRGGLPLLQVGLNSATLLALPHLPGGVPQGYLRVLSFNEDSVLVDQRTVQLSAAALNNYEPLQTGPLVVQQTGYVSVYVGNESAADVYFDDVTIEHRQGLQVQENQYDPFGLDLAGVSGAASGLRLKNFYQFNGKERQNDLGLGWSDYGARFYDAARGPIWFGIDPLADKMRRWSPYTFSFDNAIRFVDPDGMAAGDGQDGPHDPPSLSSGIRIWLTALRHPLEAMQVSEPAKGADNISMNSERFATRGASDASKSSVLTGGDGRQSNAFRHTLWSATMASVFGSEDAKSLADAHESNPNADLSQRSFSGANAMSQADMQADLLNNQIGRQIGETAKNQGMNAVAGKVLSQFATCGLYTFSKQKNGSYTVNLAQITPKQSEALQARFQQLNNAGRTASEQGKVNAENAASDERMMHVR